MRVAERLTAIRLKTLEKDTACGVVPGLYATVRKLADGSFAKYFVLIENKNAPTPSENFRTSHSQKHSPRQQNGETSSSRAMTLPNNS